MKVKQHGKIPDWDLEVKCEYCDAVITLESPKDLYSRLEFNSISRFHESEFYFECPECVHANHIDRCLIREDIRFKVKSQESIYKEIIFKVKF